MACAQAFLDSMVARNDDLDTLRTRTTLLTTGWRSSESEALESPRSQSLDSVMQFRVGATPSPSSYNPIRATLYILVFRSNLHS